MKKIINQITDIVDEMCKGFVLAHPNITYDPRYKIIKKTNLNKNKVILISGGGSGHEPAHAGFIGRGLIDAAVCGDVFASPSQIQVYQAIRGVTQKKETLLIIKNYSGDMMNFLNAKEMAQEDGLSVEYVQVNDDIAVNDSLYTIGRRGVAGTILVHKIAGAAAEAGLALSEVKRIAQKCIDHVKSIGFAFSSCTIPAKGTPTFKLDENEIEYGIGIHGEPGIAKIPILSSAELALRMVDQIYSHLKLNAGDKVAVLVNGFGATPLMELYLFNHDVAKILYDRGLLIEKTLVGNYMTSIDMAGASLSILKLDEELHTYLNAECQSAALSLTHQDITINYDEILKVNRSQQNYSYDMHSDKTWSLVGKKFSALNMVYLIEAMAKIIIEKEVEFCELDAHAGDGDFGASIAKGFKALKENWSILLTHKNNIGEFLSECAILIMEHCGGASGPIWGSAFRAAGLITKGKRELSQQEFAEMMQAMVIAIQKTGEKTFGRGAKIGDKTLIDALIPATISWQNSATANHSFKVAFENGAQAAMHGAESTKGIVAQMGRATHVGERSLGYPDAGAFALGVIFMAITAMFDFNSQE